MNTFSVSPGLARLGRRVLTEKADVKNKQPPPPQKKQTNKTPPVQGRFTECNLPKEDRKRRIFLAYRRNPYSPQRQTTERQKTEPENPSLGTDDAPPAPTVLGNGLQENEEHRKKCPGVSTTCVQPVSAYRNQTTQQRKTQGQEDRT